MVTYRDLAVAIVKQDGERVCDIAEAIGLPDHVVVRAAAKLADPYHLVTLSEIGPLGIVHGRYTNIEEALTAARNAGIELDERLTP